MVNASKGGVVDHPLRSRQQRSNPAKAAHRRRRLSPRLGDALHVKDHSGQTLFRSRCDQDELGSPRRLAVPLEMEPGVGVVTNGPGLPCG